LNQNLNLDEKDGSMRKAMAELQKSVNDDPEDDIEEWSIRYGTFLDCNVPTPCKFSSNDSYALLKHPPKVISGGGNHPALITYNGELWMSGSNIDHQCGKLMVLIKEGMKKK
ncbi:11931_t:CDS:2, partial [Entrophospora sp. SA101]